MKDYAVARRRMVREQLVDAGLVRTPADVNAWRVMVPVSSTIGTVSELPSFARISTPSSMIADCADAGIWRSAR